MGCGGSTPVDLEAEKRNAAIEKSLAQDKEKLRFARFPRSASTKLDLRDSSLIGKRSSYYSLEQENQGRVQVRSRIDSHKGRMER